MIRPLSFIALNVAAVDSPACSTATRSRLDDGNDCRHKSKHVVEEVTMLEGRTRIPPVDVAALPIDLRDELEEQRKLHGAALYPYLFYARNPAYFRAAKAMWIALQQETKRVPGALRSLLNRRVAAWNGCEF